MDHAEQGKKALEASNYAQAIEHYTAALKISPTSPDYYIQRATAHQRSQAFEAALDDANHAVVNAQKRAKRELIIEAQFRRGCALYTLGRFGDARFVLGIVKRMKDDHKSAGMWITRTENSMKSLPEDDEKRKCTVQETPDLDGSSAASTQANGHGSNSANTTTTSSAPSKPAPAPNPPVLPPQTPADKIRREWYQNTTNIYFTLLVKGAPPDKVQVDITERSLNIAFPLVTGSTYEYTLDPLFAAVDPSKCTSRVLPTKMEVILVKATPGQKWSALESSEPVASKTDSVAGAEGNEQDAIKRAIFTQSKPSAPAYPTSSKSGPKDWDKITKDLRKADVGDDQKGSERENDDDDYEGGDEANHFFKKLFKDASPEVQRAMMKSYTESNGTALSTNWEEVSKGKVETTPPDGMQAKKW